MDPPEVNLERGHGPGNAGLTMQRTQGDNQNPNQLAIFQEKVRLAGNACAQADFTTAVKLYGEALQLDPR